MHTPSVTTRRTCLVLAAVMVAALAATPAAQRRRGNDNSSQGTPVATNTIRQNPDAYYGKPVTVSAGIEQVLSKTVFVVDQRKAVTTTAVKATGAPLLVIAPYLSAPLDRTHYVLVRGQLLKFDSAAIAKFAPDYMLDLPPEVGIAFEGQPMLLATAVVDSMYRDLAKKPAPASADASTDAVQGR